MSFQQEIAGQMKEALEGLAQAAAVKRQILVVGAAPARLRDRESSLPAGRLCYETTLLCPKSRHFLGHQGCEHINRALVVEEECAEKIRLEIVNVAPYEKPAVPCPQWPWSVFKSRWKDPGPCRHRSATPSSACISAGGGLSVFP